MEFSKIVNIEKTISKDLFLRINNIWEALPKIKEYIIELGTNLDKSNYTEINKNIWIGRNVKIDKLSTIIAPCIIDDNTEIRPGAYIRGNTIIGKNCVIGNSVEIKNSIIFDNCQIPHYNYVGDSILGFHSHLGAGVIISNLKNDKTNITIKSDKNISNTNLRKMGGIIGDYVDIGCNSVVFPGTIIGNGTSIYPLTRVRGVINSDSIMKNEKEIIRKDNR